MSWLAQLLDRNSGDPRIRLELGEQLQDALSRNRLPGDSALLNDLSDLACQWIAASNFKVALVAFDLLETSLRVSGDVISPYLLERANLFLERLGDSKAAVRESAASLLTLLALAPRSSPLNVVEKLHGGFNHRQWLVRIGSMQLFTTILQNSKEEITAQAYRLLPTFCNLLADANAEVRECAAKTIAYIMCILGEETQNRIRNQHLIPESRLDLIVARASELSSKGLPTVVHQFSRAYQHVPSPLSLNGVNRTHSSSSIYKRSSFPERSSSSTMFREPRLPATAGRVGREEEEESLVPRQHSASSASAMRRTAIASSLLKPPVPAGAVNEEDFRKAFTQVPTDVLLKKMRAIVLNGGMDFEDTLISEVNNSEDAIIVSIKDLRSQVCREACITLSFLCDELKGGMVRLCETALPPLIQLIMNSAKVMATSSSLACIFIIKNVQNPKLIPVVIAGISSKSKEIRSQVLVLIALLLEWEPTKLCKNLPALVDAVRLGLGDADPSARTNARMAYSKLDAVYPKQAQILFQSLDTAKQRALAGSISQSSSSQSIVSEQDSLPLNHRPGLFGLQKQRAYYTGRSTSDIDPAAAKRAVAYTPRRIALNGSASTTGASGTISRRITARTGLPPSRPTPVASRTPRPAASPGTFSQPASRSTSPQSRIPSAKKNLVFAGTHKKSSPDLNREYSPRRGYAVPSWKEDFTLLPPAAAHKLETAALVAAIRGCESTQLAEKREGVADLYNCVAALGDQLDAVYVRKITETINKLISDPSHKLLPNVTDVICKLAEYHSAQLNEWLPTLLSKLFQGSATQQLSQPKASYMATFEKLRNTFDKEQQLFAVCKIIKNPVSKHTDKVKEQQLIYLHDLLSPRDRRITVSNEDVRGAVGKLFIWKDDPKHAVSPNQTTKSVLQLIDRFLLDLFHANESDYTVMMDSLPPASREYALKICRNSTVREGISEMTAQINDFVLDRSTSNLPPLLHSSSSPSAASHHLHTSPSSAHQRTSTSGPLPTSPLATTNGNGHLASGGRLSYPSSGTDSIDESFLRLQGVESVTMTLMDDHIRQQEFISNALRILSSSSCLPSERLSSLGSLLQMVTEGSLTLWDANFKPLILSVFEIISGEQDDALKRNALKLLSRMCIAQASRFYEYAEMSVFKVLSATIGDVNTKVIHIADECGKTLATHLPAPLVVRALLPIIGENGDARRGAAVKMLTRLLEDFDSEELLKFLPDIVPDVVKAFYDESSAVRKSVTMCLACMQNKVGGEPLKKYIHALDDNRKKLVEVYAQRAQTASNHF